MMPARVWMWLFLVCCLGCGHTSQKIGLRAGESPWDVRLSGAPSELELDADTLVWVQITNLGHEPVTASFADALVYVVEYEDGSGHSSQRIRGARSCAERHRLLPQGSLLMPLVVRASRPGVASVRIVVEARSVSEQGTCFESQFEGSATWRVLVK